MRSYEDIRNEVYSLDGKVAYPSKGDFTTYYLTHKGELVRKTTDRDTLKGLPGVIETSVDDAAFKAARQVYNDQIIKIGNIWDSELRADYPELNDETFNLIYGYAYERGHSYGMDEVAAHMSVLSIIAEKIIAANK